MMPRIDEIVTHLYTESICVYADCEVTRFVGVSYTEFICVYTESICVRMLAA